MYQEPIAKYTSDHLRSHIADYLVAVRASLATPDTIKLVTPKSITAASAVGGLMADLGKLTPMYAVEVGNKILGTGPENVIAYEYDGFITGLVMGNTKEEADKLMKRHAAACEMFVKSHEFLHLADLGDFAIIGLGFVSTEFTGAEKLPLEGDGWLAAFTVNCLWVTSENGPGQHE